ncbi:MAG: DUF3788 domain-containing protein [Smithella sp.]
MSDSTSRMIERCKPPNDSEVAGWLGSKAYKYWNQITQFIEKNYPGIFIPEWLFGGKKHGWTLRYKKSKSFCTLIPEKNNFALVIVFGAAEREKVETIKDSLSARTRKEYDEATTYHDGKWVLLSVDSESIVEDVMKLLAVKRKPKSG